MEDLEVKAEEVKEVKAEANTEKDGKKEKRLGFIAGTALVAGTCVLYKKVLKPAAIVVKNKLSELKAKKNPTTEEATSTNEE